MISLWVFSSGRRRCIIFNLGNRFMSKFLAGCRGDNCFGGLRFRRKCTSGRCVYIAHTPYIPGCKTFFFFFFVWKWVQVFFVLLRESRQRREVSLAFCHPERLHRRVRLCNHDLVFENYFWICEEWSSLRRAFGLVNLRSGIPIETEG